MYCHSGVRTVAAVAAVAGLAAPFFSPYINIHKVL